MNIGTPMAACIFYVGNIVAGDMMEYEQRLSLKENRLSRLCSYAKKQEVV